MNTLSPSLDGKTYLNRPYLRGSVYPWSMSVFGDKMLFLLNFGANNGEFDKTKKAKTTNVGVGWILHDPTTLVFQYELFHNRIFFFSFLFLFSFFQSFFFSSFSLLFFLFSVLKNKKNF